MEAVLDPLKDGSVDQRTILQSKKHRSQACSFWRSRVLLIAHFSTRWPLAKLWKVKRSFDQSFLDLGIRWTNRRANYGSSIGVSGVSAKIWPETSRGHSCCVIYELNFGLHGLEGTLTNR